MILLDTNVLSELMRAHPDPVVIAWMNRQPRLSVWISSITIFEIRLGLESRPAGKQRDRLLDQFAGVCARAIENRIAPFDSGAAHEAANLMAARNQRGFNVDLRDTMIAGIALSARATIATRNVRHFHDLHVPVVNPWDEGAKL